MNTPQLASPWDWTLAAVIQACAAGVSVIALCVAIGTAVASHRLARRSHEREERLLRDDWRQQFMAWFEDVSQPANLSRALDFRHANLLADALVDGGAVPIAVHGFAGKFLEHAESNTLVVGSDDAPTLVGHLSAAEVANYERARLVVHRIVRDELAQWVRKGDAYKGKRIDQLWADLRDSLEM